MVPDSIQTFVENHYGEHFGPEYTYHNLAHTKWVAEQALSLGKSAGLGISECNDIAIAAWFHDIGYAQDSSRHEELGAQIAEEYLCGQGFDNQRISRIKRLIMATVFTANPSDKAEEVIRDADLSYLGTSEFERISDGLRSEWEKTRGVILTDLEWVRINISFLLSHSFHTDYAMTHLEPMKRINLRLTKARLAKLLLQNKKEA